MMFALVVYESKFMLEEEEKQVIEQIEKKHHRFR